RDRSKGISRRWPLYVGPSPHRAAGDGQARGSRSRLPAMAFAPSSAAPRQARVFFERPELVRLLSLYGRMVAAGEWRDYAIDGLSDSAVFSGFRLACDQPIS